jgi:hypothetical protein
MCQIIERRDNQINSTERSGRSELAAQPNQNTSTVVKDSFLLLRISIFDLLELLVNCLCSSQVVRLF